MDNIWDINNTDFSSINLKNPKPLQGGTFFAPIYNDSNNILIIQTPKCLTKNGIHKTGKKTYTDLKFNFDNKALIKWFEELERHVRNIIFEKRYNWFHDEPSIDEIEYLWNSSIRQNKDSYLLRAFIQRFKNTEQIQIWNENNEEITIDDIENDDNLISILEIGGLKFTSQSFQLEIYLRQVIVIKDKPIFSKCLIKLHGNANKTDINKQTLSVEDEEVNHDVDEQEVDEQDVDKSDTELVENDNKVENKKILSDDSSNDIDSEKKDDDTSETNEEDLEKLNDLDSTSGDLEKNKSTVDLVEKKVNIDSNVVEIPEETKNTESKIDSTNEEPTLEKNVEIKNEINQEIEKSKTEKESLTLEKNKNKLEEFELILPEDNSTIKLKTPKDVYLEIYKKARQKALDAKKEAIKAFLEAKKIKETYLLDEWGLDSSDEEDFFEEENSMDD